MPQFLIDAPHDRRLDPYRDLKEPQSRARATFVAEGERLVLRLLDSRCHTESVLCTDVIRDRIGKKFPADLPVYIAPTPIISRLIGFQFHRGILACGSPPPEPSLESLWRDDPVGQSSLVVLCPAMRDPANLGSIVRTAAAFGAAGLVAGRAGTNPYSRRVLRTSMGSVLGLPIVQTDDWEAVLQALEQAGYVTIATVLDPDAEHLTATICPQRVAVLLGNEADGLPENLVQRCQRRVTLPMAAGVSSLNVAVAAGIVLHHFRSGALAMS